MTEDMEYNNLSQESKYYLNVLEALVSSEFCITITHHSKAIRDIMDNLEGHLYNCLNKNNRYDHGTLKYDAPFMSSHALELRKRLTKNEFLKKTHREHAKPFKTIVTEIEGLKNQALLNYILLNIKSVTILKEEQMALDKNLRYKMPDLNDVFSRFKATEIEVINRK